MQSQSSQELKRYGVKIVGALTNAGKFLREKASQVQGEAASVAKEVGHELKECRADLKEEGRKAAKILKEEVLPKAQQTLDEAGKVVRAHGGLTVRRVAAEVQELVRDPKVLEEEKQQEFELIKMVVNRKVDLRPLMREFIKSEASVISDFDNSSKPVQGVPIFPAQHNLALLKGEFMAVRIYIGPKGLTTRVYEQSDQGFESSTKPQYVLKEERPTTADDLFQLRLRAQEVTNSLTAVREAGPFFQFVSSRSY